MPQHRSAAPFRPLVTCEHGGNDVPEPYRALFAGHRELLAGHRGFDAGALELAHRLAARLGAPLVYATVTRLLVDLNRSPHHRRLFSEITRPLPAVERQAILAAHYHPYRGRVESAVTAAATPGAPPVLHLSVHSFTPQLDGERRTADLGLLYDPAREPEARFCRRLRQVLQARRGDLRVRFNYPYLGVADGLVTALRRRLPTDRYLGIEIELNQRHPLGDPTTWSRLIDELCDAVAEAAD